MTKAIHSNTAICEYYSIRQVSEKTCVSRTSIYDWSKDGSFPKARKLGKRRVAWLASEIHEWINSRPQVA